MQRNTRDTAIDRDEFHTALAAFIEDRKATVGDPRYGQTAWIWVEHLGHRYHLNADTTAAGAATYLELLKRSGGDLEWSVVANERDVENKTAFGPEKWVIEGFYLYRAQ